MSEDFDDRLDDLEMLARRVAAVVFKMDVALDELKGFNREQLAINHRLDHPGPPGDTSGADRRDPGAQPARLHQRPRRLAARPQRAVHPHVCGDNAFRLVTMMGVPGSVNRNLTTA
jgi:hypothetical protein